MTLSTNIGAYDDCIEIFERALRSERGIRISAETHSDSYGLYSRLNYARVLLRDQSRGLYSPDDPRFGRCDYDPLIVRRPRQLGNLWWLYIEQRVLTGEIEELE